MIKFSFYLKFRGDINNIKLYYCKYHRNYYLSNHLYACVYSNQRK